MASLRSPRLMPFAPRSMNRRIQKDTPELLMATAMIDAGDEPSDRRFIACPNHSIQ